MLIDFWAPWCGPCRLLNPIMKDIEKKYKGKIRLVKVNVDLHRRIAAYFRVSAVPSVFIVKDKTVIRYFPGVKSKEFYISAIEKVLKPVIKDKDSAKQ